MTFKCIVNTSVVHSSQATGHEQILACALGLSPFPVAGKDSQAPLEAAVA